MAYFVFVDNSNVWIEGKYVSGVKKGFANNIFEAHEKKAQDNGWRLDFGRLLKFVVNNETEKVKKTVLFGSKPPEKDTLWNAIGNANYEVKLRDRNYFNKEKAIDTAICSDILECLYEEAEKEDIFVLVMGDLDFAPVVDKIHKKGCFVEIVFWEQISGELKAKADKYIDLNPNIDIITYN